MTVTAEKIRSTVRSTVRSTRWRDWTVDVEVLTCLPTGPDAGSADAADHATLHEAAVALTRTRMADVAAACDRYRPDSELSVVNRDGCRYPVPVSALFAELLGAALDGAAATGGALDPTLGADLARAGFGPDGDAVPASAPAPRRHTWRDVRLDGGTLTAPASLQFDLGATAKAWAADRCATDIAGHTGLGVLVNLGGDLATAGPCPDGGWQIRVRDADGEPEDLVSLSGRAGLATSSALHRRATVDGVSHCHVLDPATGRPTTGGLRSVSVAAPDCLTANVWSTALLAATGRVTPLLAATGLPVRTVDAAGAVHRQGGWPDDGH